VSAREEFLWLEQQFNCGGDVYGSFRLHHREQPTLPLNPRGNAEVWSKPIITGHTEVGERPAVGYELLADFLMPEVHLDIVSSTSPGPVFFVQERVGLNSRVFKMLKFRTMRPGSREEGDRRWTSPNDPRRTTIGTFLQKNDHHHDSYARLQQQECVLRIPGGNG
jgi:hypothetical protein